MALKYEVYKTTAQDLEARGIIRAEYGPKSYRGYEYSVPTNVTVIDRAELGVWEQKGISTIDKAREDIAKGVYGAGARLSEAQWSHEFVTAVLNDTYPPCRVQEPRAEEPVQEPVEAVGTPTISGTDILAQVVADVVARTAGSGISEAIGQKAIEEVRAFIEREYGPIQKKVEIITPAGEVKPVQGMLHEAFDEVLAYVQADEPVFLVGPAGCGKNVLCKQIAEALGLEFYFSNAVTQEYKITGFTDAMGVFQESQFYKAFTQGGLFFLDEMDASIPEVLLILNSAIANRYFDFPAPVGRVQAHPNFRVVSAGNTVGQGASFEYVGRNQLDASSLDRFAVVQVGYDEKVETSVAGGDRNLIDFIHAVRQVCDEKGISLITSYRSIGRIAKMSKVLPLPQVLRSCLFKGMTKADLDPIRDALSGKLSNVYTEALARL